MVATFLLEASMAIYTIVRYKLTLTGRLILGLLINLALFQAAEYFVCTESTAALTASRLGYAAITLLPFLAFYLMSVLTRTVSKKIILATFAATLALVAYFLTAPGAFNGYQCTGNYVIFQIGQSQFYIYSIFYFGLIAASLWKGVRFLGDKSGAKSRQPVQWLIAGYLIFVVPVAVLVVVHPDTRAAVPSILCGFAIGMAVVLAARIAPLTLKKRS
jgi:hypothetical protein